MLDIFFVFLLCCIATSNCETCATTNSTTGTCIDINDCQYLLDLKNDHPISRENAKILLDSACGLEGGIAKVCCHESNETREFVKTDKVDRKPRFPTLSGRFGGEEEIDCGTQYSVNRIFYGVITQLEEFPWMGLLAYRSPDDGALRAACGGVLINQQYVLTAAHCILGIPEYLGQLELVRFGEYNTQTERDCDLEDDDYCADSPVNILVESVFTHPDYQVGNKNRYHDIALIKLQSPVTFSRFIQPICLPSPKFDEAASRPGNNLTVTGWGKTSEFAASSGIKLKAEVPTVSARDCRIPYDTLDVSLKNSQLCAGGGKMDSCEGDSGGPLMWENKLESRWYSIGIISFGSVPCAKPGVPAVYTRVSSYLNWINGIIKQ